MDVKKVLGPRFVRVLKRPVWRVIKALTGRRLQSSTAFLDLGMFGGEFGADAEGVNQELPRGFKAAERQSGRATLRIMGIEYRQVDLLRPYSEIAMKIPVFYTPREGELLEGWWVWQMPVTTEEARWGGVVNYGFPKYLADIQIQHYETHRVCRWELDGQLVFEMTVDSIETQANNLMNRNFTARDDGVIVESRFELRGSIGEATEVGGAKLELGTHAIADQMRAMSVELTGCASCIPRASATLSTGTVVGALESDP